MNDVHIFESVEQAAAAAAERVVAAANGAIASAGWFHVGLSGGQSPEPLFHRLASEPYRRQVDWSSFQVYFADERAVPPEHAQSNYRTARELLLDPVKVPADQVHRMHAEADDLQAAADEYQALLPAVLDLLVLGIGADGHTASLFPGSKLLFERARRVAPVYDSPRPPARRLTVTPRVIRDAREVIVLADTEDKAMAVARALEGNVDLREHPARMLRDCAWYIDRSAARGLAAAAR